MSNINKSSSKPEVNNTPIVQQPTPQIVGKQIIATRSITQKYKIGAVIPKEVYDKWVSMGIKVELMCGIK